RPGEDDTLTLTARERVPLTLRDAAGERDDVEQLLDRTVDRPARLTRVLEALLDELRHRASTFRLREVPLEDAPHRRREELLVATHPVDGAAVPCHRTAVRLDDTLHRPQERRLACTRLPDDAQRRVTGSHREAHALQH